jgi:hypothetical protein
LSLNRPWRLGRRLYIPRRRLYLRYYRPLHNSRVARDTLLLVVHSKCCLLLRALQRHSFRRTIELLMVTLNLWHLDLLHMIRANSAEVIWLRGFPVLVNKVIVCVLFAVFCLTELSLKPLKLLFGFQSDLLCLVRLFAHCNG